MAVVLSGAVLGPVPAVDQSDDDSGLTVADPTGDVLGDFGEPVDGLDYLDIRGLTLAVEDDELVVRFDVAAPSPATLDPNRPPPRIALLIDSRDGTHASEVVLDLESGFDSSEPARWRAWLFDKLSQVATELGPVGIVDRSLTVRVPIASLVVLAELRFRAEAIGFYPRSEGDQVAIAVDELPDDASWIALSSAGGSLWTMPERGGQGIRPAELVPRDVSGLFDVDTSGDDLESIRRDLVDYVSARPEASELLGVTLGLKDHVFDACDNELAEGSEHFDQPIYLNAPITSTCGQAFLALYMTYAQTGDSEVADLIGRFVGGTASQLPPEGREGYISFVSAIPHWAYWDHADLFAPSEP